jgi:predicted RNase H-like HicB family nuclease
MKPLRIPLRAVFYRESGRWVAHCLEFDLSGDGETPEAALKDLSEAIACQVEATLQNGNLANLFSPADGKFFAMFAAGTDLALGPLQLRKQNVTIEELQTREYTDPDVQPAVA